MSPNEDAYVHRQLGELAEGMRGLQQSMQRMEKSGRRSEDKSDASRAVVHKRMDELVSRVGTLEAVSSEIKEDVSEMKPVTDDVKRWKLMGIGALGVIGIGGMVLGVTFADAVRRIGMVIIGKG
ncbi:ElaB/YqjD/DUF883 family membrane-anchored ribosome-binding protein [Rhizobium azooxidifex]|uniref:ElaB/YqjD/DUF883 family membrane-anchored ribosome-binding protein n=1 Tax=Mycoplana azooxidifex TaxID=1636188 RepID=A0A7W6GMM5_9HYPH|nr:DUF1515 family protein [Mycoplana azooxidifex]MBB3979114.1 ElaB/YqjD/DUF883 family membrane-anchored ribosome-binding protein [Mycoplana azooxidifex]